MDANERRKVRAQVKRLRIFHYVKQATETTNDVWPSVDEVSAALDLPRATTAVHMAALRRADGLPARTEGCRRGWQRGLAGLLQSTGANLRGSNTDHYRAPVDVYFRRRGCV